MVNAESNTKAVDICVTDDVEAGNRTSNARTSLAEPQRPLRKARSLVSPWLAQVRLTLYRKLSDGVFELRGIERVLPSERHDIKDLGYTQVCLFWLSANLEAIMITLGMLGPTSYLLSFWESSLLGGCGALVGALPVAYIATFGPRSGLRTMILTRYITGWYPSKLIVSLTLVIIMGYTTVDSIIGGQILSAVASSGDLTVVTGIVVICTVSWTITTFGYRVFHVYERYAWLPQLIALSLLAGVAGPHFHVRGTSSVGEERTVIGNRLSFFSLCLASQITYAQAAADYFVYYPPSTSRIRMFLATALSLLVSSVLTLMIGAGLASGITTNAEWSEAYRVSQGALIVEAFRPLGSLGSFCSVILALGLIGNVIPGIYASGIDFQAMGRYFAKVPRPVWNGVAILLPMVCAISGRQRLVVLFTNFLSLVGYWVSIWIAIVLEEHLIFRKWQQLNWDWEAWNQRTYFPAGIAALSAFVIGWVGTSMCMAQAWYVGPLARQVSAQGGDLGNYAGFICAALTYPGMRMFELRKLKK